MDFLNVPNLYKRVHRFTDADIKPIKIFSTSRFGASHLLAQCKAQDSTRLLRLDCSTYHIKQTGTPTQVSSINKIQDGCCIEKNGNTQLVYVSGDIHCQDSNGKLVWSIHGAVTGTSTAAEIRCCSLCTDDNGHLFVCDSSNKCIHLFSTDGVYLDCVAKEYEFNLGTPIFVRWCKKTSSLVVGHSGRNLRTNSYTVFHISVLKTNNLNVCNKAQSIFH